MRHSWAEDDDTKLKNAVESCLPIRKELSGPREVFWAMVVGKMGVLDITPGAARSRWEKLVRDNNDDSNNSDSVWKTVALQVEEYERDLQERTWDVLVQVHKEISGLREDVSKLISLWE